MDALAGMSCQHLQTRSLCDGHQHTALAGGQRAASGARCTLTAREKAEVEANLAAVGEHIVCSVGMQVGHGGCGAHQRSGVRTFPCKDMSQQGGPADKWQRLAPSGAGVGRAAARVSLHAHQRCARPSSHRSTGMEQVGVTARMNAGMGSVIMICGGCDSTACMSLARRAGTCMHALPLSGLEPRASMQAAGNCTVAWLLARSAWLHKHESADDHEVLQMSAPPSVQCLR